MKYPSKTLVKSITPVPRTISEANRDARYACAIQSFRSDAKLAWNFIVDCLIGFVVTIALASPFVVGFYMWLNK
jgi:hypothetical protein